MKSINLKKCFCVLLSVGTLLPSVARSSAAADDDIYVPNIAKKENKTKEFFSKNWPYFAAGVPGAGLLVGAAIAFAKHRNTNQQDADGSLPGAELTPTQWEDYVEELAKEGLLPGVQVWAEKGTSIQKTPCYFFEITNLPEFLEYLHSRCGIPVNSLKEMFILSWANKIFYSNGDVNKGMPGFIVDETDIAGEIFDCASLIFSNDLRQAMAKYFTGDKLNSADRSHENRIIARTNASIQVHLADEFKNVLNPRTTGTPALTAEGFKQLVQPTVDEFSPDVKKQHMFLDLNITTQAEKDLDKFTAQQGDLHSVPPTTTTTTTTGATLPKLEHASGNTTTTTTTTTTPKTVSLDDVIVDDDDNAEEAPSANRTTTTTTAVLRAKHLNSPRDTHHGYVHGLRFARLGADDHIKSVNLMKDTLNGNIGANNTRICYWVEDPKEFVNYAKGLFGLAPDTMLAANGSDAQVRRARDFIKHVFALQNRWLGQDICAQTDSAHVRAEQKDVPGGSEQSGGWAETFAEYVKQMGALAANTGRAVVNKASTFVLASSGWMIGQVAFNGCQDAWDNGCWKSLVELGDQRKGALKVNVPDLSAIEKLPEFGSPVYTDATALGLTKGSAYGAFITNKYSAPNQLIDGISFDQIAGAYGYENWENFMRQINKQPLN